MVTHAVIVEWVDTGFMKRTLTGRAALVLGSAMALLATQGHDVHASGAGGPLRDGNWAGTMAVGVTIDFSTAGAGLIASGSGNGTFNLGLSGGTAAGDFVLGASSSASLEAQNTTGNADAVGAITGVLEGTASAPILQPQQAHIDVTGLVTVNGFDVPLDYAYDFGQDELLGSTMVITASSCTMASGTWAQELKASIEAAGASATNFQGSWAARFVGATPGATDTALTDLLARGEAILSSWFATGDFDAEALGQVLIDAEHFAVSGPTTTGCSAGRGSWSSPLSGLVERLLTAMAHSPSTTAEDLWFGVAAGLRKGNLPSVGQPLEGELLTKATELLDLAIADGAASDVTMIAIAADSMGWTELSATATAALAAMP